MSWTAGLMAFVGLSRIAASLLLAPWRHSGDVSVRCFADREMFEPAVRQAFGTRGRLRDVSRLPGGTNKGVYRLVLDDGWSVLAYRWSAGEDFWPASFYDRGPFATDREHGRALFLAAHERLSSLGVRVPRLLFDDGTDMVLVEELTGGTLGRLLLADRRAGLVALDELRGQLERMHSSTSLGIGHGGDDFPGVSCERFAHERALDCLAEAAARIPRLADARADLEALLRALLDAIAPRSIHSLIHGELGPDHVRLDDGGAPALIDIEGLTYFDVEWEHAFLELRFGVDYPVLAADALDDARLRLYRLVHHLSLAAGPLMLLDGDFPHRELMLRISQVNVDHALRQLTSN